MASRVQARFNEPMLPLRTDVLPDHPAHWAYQSKFDGYRAAQSSGMVLSCDGDCDATHSKDGDRLSSTKIDGCD